MRTFLLTVFAAVGLAHQGTSQEGVSIFGWEADIPRHRERYKTVAEAVVEARRATPERPLLIR
jgi:hypothetical protein